MSEVDLRVASTAIYEELVEEHARATGMVEDRASGALDALSNWFKGVDSSVIGAWRGSLAQAGRLIARLSPAPTGDLTVSLLAGRLSWEQWRFQAAMARKHIQGVLEELGTVYREGRFWTEVVAATGQGVADLATKAVDQVDRTLDLVPWVAAAAVALVVGYLVFTFRLGRA